jgi:transcriptional regulator GlxA family with amidase domain
MSLTTLKSARRRASALESGPRQGLRKVESGQEVDVRIRRNVVLGARRWPSYVRDMQSSQRVPPKRIGLVGFDGVTALDLTGVLEAFRIADGADWRAPPARYETLVLGLTRAPFVAESGLRIQPDARLDQAPDLDTVVVPGGPGLREPGTNAIIAEWLRSRAGSSRRLVSVCTGLYGLAATGLMTGRRATTHWRHAADCARRFPELDLVPDAIFIKDSPFYSSAGMTAGIDLTLSLIEEDHGPSLALATARQLVVYARRSGGQLQYSEPLRFQTRAPDRFADLVARIGGDLGADWSVERMAAETGLSPRQFSRRFRAAFAATPAAFLEALRLDDARVRLDSGGIGVEGIAHAVGFQSGDVFRRAFERRFGVTPSGYRHRFTTSNAPRNPQNAPAA